MHILILTLGSRGDVQPYIALGIGLQAAGHTVTLTTLPTFEGLATENRLAFRPLRGEFLELLQTLAGKAAIIGKGNPLALLRMVTPMLRGMLDDGWSAAQDVDAIIYHPKALGGHSIAEKLGIPGILALPLPLYSPTRAFPSPILPVAHLGAGLNRASHQLIVRLASASTRGMLNRWRKEVLGLPAAGDELTLNGRPTLRLYGYSPALVPTPSDWDAHSVATGYWFLDQPSSWHPPDSLIAFLRAGPPPIYIGFGSMPSQDAAAKTALVLAALERAGQRGVLATGWGGLTATNLPSNVYALAFGGANAANLFEMVRFHGAGLVVTAQSYAGLGADADRMLGAAAGLILHQCADPEHLLVRAGQRLDFQRHLTITERGMGQVVKEYAVGEGMLAQTDALKVDPNAVKQLGPGECVVIAQGRAQHVAVSHVRIQESTPVLPAPPRSTTIVEIDPTMRQAQRERALRPLPTRAPADLGGSENDTAAQPSTTTAPLDESIREY